nr:MAG TPA: Putative CRISPR-associated protein [Caudoviricetes sp.]
MGIRHLPTNCYKTKIGTLPVHILSNHAGGIFF